MIASSTALVEIVGVSCRILGGIKNHSELWHALCEPTHSCNNSHSALIAGPSSHSSTENVSNMSAFVVEPLSEALVHPTARRAKPHSKACLFYNFDGQGQDDLIDAWHAAFLGLPSLLGQVEFVTVEAITSNNDLLDEALRSLDSSACDLAIVAECDLAGNTVLLVFEKSDTTLSNKPYSLGTVRSVVTKSRDASLLPSHQLDSYLGFIGEALLKSGKTPGDIQASETVLSDEQWLEQSRHATGTIYDTGHRFHTEILPSGDGSCHQTPGLLGILKALSMFAHRAIPPHYLPIEPSAIHSRVLPVTLERPFSIQVNTIRPNTFSSIILEEPLHPMHGHNATHPLPVQGVIAPPLSDQGQRTSSPSVSTDSVRSYITQLIPPTDVELSANDNIFEAGVDSVTSIHLANHLSKISQRSVTPADLYHLLTVEKICQWLNDAENSLTMFSQQDLHEWIAEYGAPFILPRSPSRGLSAPKAFSKSILLTGATGVLGSQLLSRLLQEEAYRVFCIVRGNALQRLSSTFSDQGLDINLLYGARQRDRLLLIKSSDLGDEYMGCNQNEYSRLIDEVTEIVHCAWKVDFNLGVEGFRSCLQGTRNLAQLCYSAKNRIRFHFISSFSSSFGYEGTLVPEIPLDPRLEYATTQGYAISKLIAEHSLYRTLHNMPKVFDLTIIRVGQICGHSITGAGWSQDQMIPMIIQSIPVYKAIPASLPDVSWIPLDVCADTLVDIISCNSLPPISVLNVANPHVVPWKTVAQDICALLQIDDAPLVSIKEYVERIDEGKGDKTQIARLLPYLSSISSHEGLPLHYCSLQVEKAVSVSPSLAACPAINAALLKRFVNIFIKNRINLDLPPIYLFGSWTNYTPSEVNDDDFLRIRDDIFRVSEDVRASIGYTSPDAALDRQLNTLALQLKSLQKLEKRNTKPCAVLGYSFGEFAACIAAGILSQPTAVLIITQRAASLTTTTGSMLNVFAPASSARRQLSTMPDPPAIGITAGPSHVVLSGTHAQITRAQDSFKSAGWKTVRVNTTLPFHSPQMDNASRQLQTGPYTPQPPRPGCDFISGVTGSSITSARLLGPNYWSRQMQEPVRFSECMKYLDRCYRVGTPILDLGPGDAMKKVVVRYGPEFPVLEIEEYLADTYAIKKV